MSRLISALLAAVVSILEAKDRFNQAHPEAGFRPGKYSHARRPRHAPAGTKLARKAFERKIGVRHV